MSSILKAIGAAFPTIGKYLGKGLAATGKVALEGALAASQHPEVVEGVAKAVGHPEVAAAIATSAPIIEAVGAAVQAKVNGK